MRRKGHANSGWQRSAHPCNITSMGRAETTIAGIFVGGAASRMQGHPKGLLRVPSGETIIERWRGIFEGLRIACVLVGSNAAYGDLPLEVLEDEPAGVGPVGGLVALLARAGGGNAVAVACDMPHVGAPLVEWLVRYVSPAPIVAPRRDDRWEPLFARYDARVILPLARARAAATHRSLQGLLDAAGAAVLPLAPPELAQLGDWDAWDDVNRDARTRGS
jgi:molybdopterin-guanine dinucleotide biosynthesis protein A